MLGIKKTIKFVIMKKIINDEIKRNKIKIEQLGKRGRESSNQGTLWAVWFSDFHNS